MGTRAASSVWALALTLVLGWGARAGAGQVAARPARLRLDEARLVDLTHSFDSRTIYWPTAQPFVLEPVARGVGSGGYWYAANNFRAAEHGGTHMDAPIHFARGHRAVDKVPLARCLGPAAIIDVTEAAGADADYAVRPDDILRWEKHHGRLQPGTIVLVRTGWARYWPDRSRYLGSDKPGDVEHLHFPGLSAAAARFLVTQRSIDAVGIDTASIDPGSARDFPAHRVLTAADVPIFENLANLNALPPAGAYIIALPMKIGGGTGAPLRAVAVLP